MTINNPAYRTWLGSVVNPYETIAVLEKSEVSDVDLSDIADALDEYVRLFKAEIASPAEILTLSRAYPDEEKYSLAVIDKELDQEEPVVIGGPASVEVVDREGHLITLDAMKRAFERFMANFRTRNAMVLHSDVQVGWALPAYISKTGKIYKSGVTGDHLFFITELRNDTKIAKKVLEQIDTGKMKSYSIAGSATSVEPMQKASGMVMQVNDMELAEVTICEQGVNQKAKFELMKSSAERPTTSCVDGSCLIKAQTHIHSETELFVNEDGIIDTVGSFVNWTQKSMYDDPEERLSPQEEAARRAENRKMVEENKNFGGKDTKRMPGRYTGPSVDAPTSNKGLIEDMQKSSLEQLEDHLVEKGIGDVARGAGKAVGAAVEGVKNVGREFKSGVESARPKTAGEASANTGGAKSFANAPIARGKAGVDPNVTIRDKDAAKVGKGFREYMANRAAAKEGGKKYVPKAYSQGRKAWKDASPDDPPDQGYYMEKSHSQGCVCDTCGSASSWEDKHADDSSRDATDRQGRPTLGHTGHGNVVAILVSRMQKARTKEQQDKGLGERVKQTDIGGDYEADAQTAANYAHRIATGNEGYGSVDSPRSRKAQAAIKHGGIKGAARHGGRKAIEEDWTPSLQRHHERETSRVGRRAAELGRESKHPYDKKATQNDKDFPLQDMELAKAVYEYINKSKGNPGPGKKGRAQYKKEQGQREEKVGGTNLDSTVQEKRSYGRYRQQHPQSEEYRGGKSSLPYGSPAKRLEDAKYYEHDENMRNDPNHYDPHDVYDAGSYPGGTLEPPDPRHNPDTTPAHRKWQANPSRYPALNTPPEYHGDKGLARRERAKKAEAKGLGRGPDTRAQQSKSPPGGDTGRHVQSMQKAVYEFIHKAFKVPSKEELKAAADKRKEKALADAKERYGESFTPADTSRRRKYTPRTTPAAADRKTTAQDAWRKANPGQPDPESFANMLKALNEYLEKGVLGSIGKVVGGAAKGAAKVGAKVAGAGVAAGEALLTPGESGKSIIGNVTRVGEGAAGESKSNTPKMPGMDMNMEKQEPEWTTPQTETPLHKFLDHTKERER